MAPLSKPVIGITLGDPKGIGPEIVAKACADPHIQSLCAIRIFGDDTILAAAQRLVHNQPHSGGEGVKPRWGNAPLRGEAPRALLAPVDARWSAQWVANGVKAALAGEIDALVTAPINKHRWHQAGIHFAGHTEYLAYLSGETGTQIAPLFIAPRWRVALVTGHVSLDNVARTLNRERITAAALLTQEFLRARCGIADPRLACLGLNPHAGEQGLFGFEEEEIIGPAISLLHDRGVHIEGPFPADTFFTSDVPRPTSYHAVLAMYHDQGLIPLKTMSFYETVQVTMGLPFVRTSVDHGTAEEIAGQGVADHRNMAAAIRMAVTLVQQRHETH